MRPNSRRKVHQLTPEVLHALPREELSGYRLAPIIRADAEAFGDLLQRAVDAWPHGELPITRLRVRLVASSKTGIGDLGRETLELRDGVVHKMAATMAPAGLTSAYAMLSKGVKGHREADILEGKGWIPRGGPADAHILLADAPSWVTAQTRENPFDGGDAQDGDDDDDDDVELGHGASTWAGPHSQLVRKAMSIYTLWTEKPPDDSSLWQDVVTVQNVDWDELDVRCVGYGNDILYTSDKWEKPGVLEKYHHPFGPVTCPGVFCAAHDGEGGEPVSVAKLLGQRDLKTVALTPLALCDELVVQVPDEPHMTWRFSSSDDPPAVCSSMDKKCLVILSKDKGPVFIRGGRMRVTARGIVG